MSKNQTILQIRFLDGKTKTVEYEGDDLVGITALLDKEKELASVRIKTIGPKGEIVFDNGFSYVPAEETGKIIEE
jgi:hypothetical protein